MKMAFRKIELEIILAFLTWKRW